jgi:type VI secretion system secreted protein Hcp
MFLKIEGVDGESLDADHKGWCDVLSYENAMSREAGFGIPGDAPSRHMDFAVTKELDRATPILAQLCSEGAPLSSATLEITAPSVSAGNVAYMKYELTDVVVTSVSTSGAAGGDVPQETVTLNYGKVRWTYYRRDATGGLVETVQRDWDVAATAPPQPAAARPSSLQLK